MYTGLVFTGYVAALCLGVIGVTIAVLILMKEREKKTELFKAVLIFSILILLVAALYFYFFCREKIAGQYIIPVAWRFTDYLLCAAVIFGWTNVLAKLSESRNCVIAGAVVSGIQAVSGCIVTAVYGSGYYEIYNDGAAVSYAVIESVLTVLLSVIILWYTIKYVRREIDTQRIFFAAANSTLILIWCFDQTIVDAGLYIGRFGMSAWELNIFDPTSPLMILMALLTLLFMFREDFSPLYFTDNKGKEDAAEDVLDQVARENKLSMREFDTMKLIYEGYSNLEIADELCISVNTVKKHAKNIYTKIGVTGRMDLVMFITRKKD